MAGSLVRRGKKSLSGSPLKVTFGGRTEIGPHRLEISDSADADLFQIYQYIALREQSIARADSVAEVISSAFDQVVANPGIAHLREDLTLLDVRFFTVFKYLVICSVDDQVVTILRVLHGYRDVAAELRRLEG